MPVSFKQEFTVRRAGYRTPSPPRHAVEPLSPPLGRWPQTAPSHTELNGAKKRKVDHSNDTHTYPAKAEPVPNGLSSAGKGSEREPTARPQSKHHPSALDVFAAVATSPSLAQEASSPSTFHSPTSTTFTLGHTPLHPFERSSKRSHSDVVNRRPVIATENRPITSHVGSVPSQLQSAIGSPLEPPRTVWNKGLEIARSPDHNILQQDAELLLSFARGSYDKRSDSNHPNLAGAREHGLYHHLPNGHHLPLHGIAGPLDISLSSSQRARESKPLLPVLGPSAAQTKTALADWGSSEPNGIDRKGRSPLQQPIVPDQSKPREHRGWPKGKPRGPKAPGAGRKKRNEAGVKRVEAKDTETAGDRKRAKQRKGARFAGDTDPSQTDPFAVPDGVRRPRRVSFHANVLSTADELVDHRRRTRPSSAPPDPYKGFIASKMSNASSNFSARGKNSNRTPEEIEFCPLCQLRRNEIEGFQDLWINCNGCKTWIHATCAGFESEKKVKEVDKFYCKRCEDKHGPSTYVRKSSRAHASVDYAGLNEGKIRTADDIVGHHYIDPIKDGTLQFQPESFPRMPPELVTAEYFARIGGWTEPILIPAALNPRPIPLTTDGEKEVCPESTHPDACTGTNEGHFSDKYDYECVPDEGQDKLDMVIPYGLTVRRVADLYGPEEKVDVIDVKLQEGEDRRWSMRDWADYYEAKGEKPVRNVISLEVSQSMLGRLIRRPKVVRDLDLQDSVWPEEETAKGVYPRVQFYCLMSVADCYTDFHIDFGGSSVYYHILKGRKTFFFIPPKQKYLKKYEEWCNSPDQNSVFLGSETKECYRVDLYPGDTMLIPSGWIHAVWTPENSLVIGGNFLTRLHYSTQIQVNEIEKNTNVPRKFRYPYFQRILWLAVVRYLEQDPVPSTVVDLLCAGGVFERKEPVWYQGLLEDEYVDQRLPEHSNSRFYPQSEIEGLPDLIRFVYRTVMVSLGKVPNVTKTAQEAVARSMPKGYGNHLDLLKTFAVWAAWKRGNEPIPPWAYPNAPVTDLEAPQVEKKPSLAAQKRLERQAQHEAHKIASGRRTLRPTTENAANASPEANPMKADEDTANSPSEPRRPACDECRRRRRRCTHHIVLPEKPAELANAAAPRFGVKSIVSSAQDLGLPAGAVLPTIKQETLVADPAIRKGLDQDITISGAVDEVAVEGDAPDAPMTGLLTTATEAVGSGIVQADVQAMQALSGASPGDQAKKAKMRACSDCKKSKRRCIHGENGQVDPIKAQEASASRGSSSAKRPRSSGSNSRPGSSKKVKAETESGNVFALSTPGATEPAAFGQQVAEAAASLGVLPRDDQGREPSEFSGGRVANGSDLAGENSRKKADGDEGEMRDEVGGRRKERSRSRTSSSNQHTSSSDSGKASRSSAASPLTEPEPTSPDVNGEGMHCVRDGEKESENQSAGDGPVGTPRARKPVERYVDVSPHKSQVSRDRGRSTSSKTPPKPDAARLSGATPKGRGGRAASKESMFEASVNKAKSKSPSEALTGESEEDESMKLARLLAGEEHGLRRRGGK